jgi:hypothetical protein
MLRLYAARIEDLGQGDFVKVDCIEAFGSPAHTHAAGLATKRRTVSQPQYFRSNTPSLLAAVAARGRPWCSVGPLQCGRADKR